MKKQRSLQSAHRVQEVGRVAAVRCRLHKGAEVGRQGGAHRVRLGRAGDAEVDGVEHPLRLHEHPPTCPITGGVGLHQRAGGGRHGGTVHHMVCDSRIPFRQRATLPVPPAAAAARPDHEAQCLNVHLPGQEEDQATEQVAPGAFVICPAVAAAAFLHRPRQRHIIVITLVVIHLAVRL